MQIARQVVKLNASDLRLPSRAWKVKLVGEGADDAGGVFDDTITEMCQVLPDLWLSISVYVFPVHLTARVFLIGAGNGSRGPAHTLPQCHSRGGLQPRQVRGEVQRSVQQYNPCVP